MRWLGERTSFGTNTKKHASACSTPGPNASGGITLASVPGGISTSALVKNHLVRKQILVPCHAGEPFSRSRGTFDAMLHRLAGETAHNVTSKSISDGSLVEVSQGLKRQANALASAGRDGDSISCRSEPDAGLPSSAGLSMCYVPDLVSYNFATPHSGCGMIFCFIQDKPYPNCGIIYPIKTFREFQT